MHPTALSASKQSHAQRWVHNALGIAHHLAADWDEASSEFGIALELAEHLAQRGDAHDAYVDLVGVLIDSAANDICCDDMNGAETKLKRGAYMLKVPQTKDAQSVCLICTAYAAEHVLLMACVCLHSVPTGPRMLLVRLCCTSRACSILRERSMTRR